MMFLLSVSFALILKYVAGLDIKPCEFETYRFLPLAEAEKCLSLEPFHNDTAAQLYDSLQRYIEISAFVNILKDPPHPYEHMKIDQVTELNKLRQKAEAGEYESEYAAQKDLLNLYARFKDKHQVYIPNLCFVLLYALPVQVIASFKDSKTQFRIYPSSISEGENTLLQVYNTLVSSGIITGSSAEEINSAAGKYIAFINDRDPVDFLRELGEGGNYAYDTVINMNQFIEGLLSFGNTFDNPFPKYQELTFTLTDNTIITASYIYAPIMPITSEATVSKCLSSSVTAPQRSVAELFRSTQAFEVTTESESTPSERFTEKPEWGFESLDGGNYVFKMFSDVETGEDVGVLWLKTFNFVGAEVLNLQARLMQMYNDPMLSKVIIDVRGNGGGSVLLNNYMNSWINWDASEPNSDLRRQRVTDYIRWKLEHSDVLQQVFGSGIGDYNTFDPWDFSIMHMLSELVDQAKNYTYTDATVEPPVNHTEIYTDFFTLYNEDIPVAQGSTLRGGYHFMNFLPDVDRVDVAIISNGLCGSSCSEFLWLAQELGTARIITVGGFKTETQELLPDFQAFGGGNVWDSQTYIDPIRTVGEYLGLDVSPLPGPLPDGATTRFIETSLFSMSEPEKCYQFKQGRGDFHIFHYSFDHMGTPEYESEYPGFLDEIFGVLDDHMAYPEAEKSRDAKRTGNCPQLDGWVQGQLWDEQSKSYSGNCVRLYCGAGFYFNFTSEQCQELPSLSSKLVDLSVSLQALLEENEALTLQNADLAKEKDLVESNTKTSIIVLGVLTALFGAAVIAFAVLFFVFGHKKSGGNVSGGLVMP